MSSPLEGVAGAPRPWRAQLGEHRQHLWDLCYRMTGSASDADDLVQETFRRALEAPPPDVARDARPWLVRVAVNLSRDALRERRRRGYTGTWLPAPIETPDDPAPEPPVRAPGRDAEARYGDFESVSVAFLLMLEALTPSQRAVLVLRDVFDYSVDETAAALGMGVPNVKTTLHRARKAIEGHPPSSKPTPELVRRTRQALQAFCVHLAMGNVPALEALLARDVVARNDGNGEFFALRKPLVGIARVLKFHLFVMRPTKLRFEVRSMNGMPALVVETAPTDEPRVARRYVVRVELDAAGRIATIDSVAATGKLRGVDFTRLREPRLRDLVEPALAALTMASPAVWLPAAARLLVQRVRRSILAGERPAGR